MNGWTFVALADAQTMPWKNGGGITHELLAGPEMQDWRWRFSVADVAQSGPFSSFPGVWRCFAVLSGAGVVLDVEGELHRMTVGSAPFGFHGEAKVDCTLIDGATQDFNLMVRGGSVSMERVTSRFDATVAGGKLAAVYTVAPSVIVMDGTRTQLGAQVLAWRVMDADADVQVTSTSALWMEAGI